MSVEPRFAKPKQKHSISSKYMLIKPVLLIIDDEFKSFATLPYFIKSRYFSPILVSDEQQAIQAIHDYKNRIKLILLDQKSSRLGGGGFIQIAKKIIPQTAFLITFPLGPILYHANRFYELNQVNFKNDIDIILSAIAEKTGLFDLSSNDNNLSGQPLSFFGPIIGQSREMNQIYKLIQTIKNSTSTVCIQGESGTGKELIAKTIHEHSPKKNNPFIAINCCSIPSNLAESEFFGHEKGAFTSASNQHKGKFELAGNGTLFLDEIGELEPNIQTKLLRFLQEKEFHRVGGNSTIHSHSRIITATNRDLYQDVINGRFREDLFYRINVIPIYIPPLRKRRQDIPLLLEHFFNKYCQTLNCKPPQITEDALEALNAFSYPGNIRELMNIVERLSVTCNNQIIKLEDLPFEIQESAGTDIDQKMNILQELPEGGVPLQHMERELILKTLEKTSGNKSDASRMLGITRRLLYLRLKEYGLSSSSTTSF